MTINKGNSRADINKRKAAKKKALENRLKRDLLKTGGEVFKRTTPRKK